MDPVALKRDGYTGQPVGDTLTAGDPNGATPTVGELVTEPATQPATARVTTRAKRLRRIARNGLATFAAVERRIAMPRLPTGHPNGRARSHFPRGATPDPLSS
jgi:hypothetical protein